MLLLTLALASAALAQTWPPEGTDYRADEGQRFNTHGTVSVAYFGTAECNTAVTLAQGRFTCGVGCDNCAFSEPDCVEPNPFATRTCYAMTGLGGIWPPPGSIFLATDSDPNFVIDGTLPALVIYGEGSCFNIATIPPGPGICLPTIGYGGSIPGGDPCVGLVKQCYHVLPNVQPDPVPATTYVIDFTSPNVYSFVIMMRNQTTLINAFLADLSAFAGVDVTLDSFKFTGRLRFEVTVAGGGNDVTAATAADYANLLALYAPAEGLSVAAWPKVQEDDLCGVGCIFGVTVAVSAAVVVVCSLIVLSRSREDRVNEKKSE